jgi:hypothetical protein
MDPIDFFLYDEFIDEEENGEVYFDDGPSRPYNDEQDEEEE